jgi:hypothetical protein
MLNARREMELVEYVWTGLNLAALRIARGPSAPSLRMVIASPVLLRDLAAQRVTASAAGELQSARC